MADIRKIGEVTAGTASTIDRYEVYFDADLLDSGSEFTVDKNGVNLVEGSADDLFPEDFSFLYWTNLGVELFSADEALIYYFTKIPQWPYFEQQSRTNQSAEFGDINDMVVTAKVKQAATDLETTDGQLTFKVYGTNNPFTLRVSGRSFAVSTSLGAFNGYTVDVTTGLGAGDHQWQVDDSKGFQRVGIITIPTADENGETSYGLHYYFDFIHKSNEYRVELHERGYSGSTSQIDYAGKSPIVINTNGQGLLLHEIFLFETSATFSLVSETFGEWRAIAQSDDEKYLLKIFNDNTGTAANMMWQGFVTPQSYNEDYTQAPYITRLTAHDRTADLKNYEFTQKATIYVGEGEYEWLPSLTQTKEYETLNQPIKGYFSELEIIDFCLSKLNLNQKYRVAINLFEDDHDSASTDTPLEQTYIDTRCYYTDGRAMNCSEILQAVLTKYKAHVLNWGGYWYIISKKDLESATVNYVQYSTALAQDDTGSWSPRITWGQTSESNYYRYKGPQNLGYTPIYKNINVITEYNNANGKNGFAGDPTDQFWDGWSFFVGNTASGQAQSFFTSRQELRNNKREWTTGIGRENSYSYWQLSGEMEGSVKDKVYLKFTIRPDIELVTDIDDPDIRLRSPYFPLKWQLKVGDYYLDSSGNWGLTEVINERFIESLGQDVILEIEEFLPDNDDFSNTYNLRIYSGSIFEATVLSDGTLMSSTSKSGLRTLIKAIDTDSDAVEGGTRIIGRVQPDGILGNAQLYYYEMAEVEDADALSGFVTDMESMMWALKPDDFNDPNNLKMWIQRGAWSFNYGPYDTDNLNGAYTATTLKDVEFRVLPKGEEAPEEEILTLAANLNNKIDLDVKLFHYDLSGQVTGDQLIYNNYTRLSDNTQTGQWGDDDKKIQQLIGEYLVEKYGIARQKISGNFYSDIVVTPLNVLYNDGDDNTILFLNGITMDYGQADYSGEAQEIDSDNTPTYRDWDSSDWNTSDWA